MLQMTFDLYIAVNGGKLWLTLTESCDPLGVHFYKLASIIISLLKIARTNSSILLLIMVPITSTTFIKYFGEQ